MKSKYLKFIVVDMPQWTILTSPKIMAKSIKSIVSIVYMQKDVQMTVKKDAE